MVSSPDYNALLLLSEEEARLHAEKLTKEDIQGRLEAIWQAIRGANLHGGQPRSPSAQQSLTLARVGFALSSGTTDLECRGEGLAMMAYALNANECHGESLNYAQEAIELFERIGKDHRAARIRLGLVVALSQLGRVDEALEVARHADAVLLREADAVGRARLSVNLGTVYQRIDEHEKALVCHRAALTIFEQLGDRRAQAQCSLNMGNALGMLDRFAEADRMYGAAEELAANLGLSDLQIQSRYNRAYLHLLRGHYNRAIAAYKAMRPCFVEQESLRHAALCDLDEAECYLQINLPAEAAPLAERAAKSFANQAIGYEQAKALAFLGTALTQNRQFADALDIFQRAHRVFQAEKNQYWLAQMELYRAEVLFTLGRFWESKSQVDSARDRFQELNVPHKIGLCLILSAHLSLELSNGPNPASYVTEIQSFIHNVDEPLLRFSGHAICGKICEYLENTDLARKYYEAAAAEGEAQLSRFSHDDLRTGTHTSKQAVYAALVRIRLGENTSESASDAFLWSEKSKAATLTNLLANYMPSVRAHSGHTLLARVSQLRDEINSHYVRSREQRIALPGLARTAECGAKDMELSRILSSLADVDPEYVSLQEPPVVDISDLRKKLGPDAALVEYFVARDEVLAFVVGPSGLQVCRHLCPLSRAEYLANQMTLESKKFLRRGTLPRADETQPNDNFYRFLQELDAHLVAPVLKGFDVSRLVVVPHGVLHYLPIHASFDGQSHLIDRFDVSYAPSAATWVALSRKEAIPGGRKVCFSALGGDFAPETDGLRQAFPELRTLTGAGCTKAEFANGAPGTQWIHLVTAVQARKDAPILSGFQFADGWMTALELFSMSAETSLVWLSGTQGGAERAVDGDDILSLQRGLLYMGARSIMMSLWQPSPEPNALFAQAFYTAWRPGSTGKVSAFRHAIRQTREAFPHPCHWAPYILSGQDDAHTGKFRDPDGWPNRLSDSRH